MHLFLYLHNSPIIVIHTHPQSLLPNSLKKGKQNCIKCAFASKWLTDTILIQALHISHTCQKYLQLKNKWDIIYSSSPHITHQLLYRIIPLLSRLSLVAIIFYRILQALTCAEGRVLIFQKH